MCQSCCFLLLKSAHRRPPLTLSPEDALSRSSNVRRGGRFSSFSTIFIPLLGLRSTVRSSRSEIARNACRGYVYLHANGSGLGAFEWQRLGWPWAAWQRRHGVGGSRLHGLTLRCEEGGCGSSVERGKGLRSMRGAVWVHSCGQQHGQQKRCAGNSER